MSKTAALSPDAKLRLPAEVIFAGELAALAKEDGRVRPPGWKLSPRRSSPT